MSDSSAPGTGEPSGSKAASPAAGKTTHTAILVIHGIGEQNPYETLDSFARGLARHFREQGAAPRLRPERISHKDWTEVAVHLEFDAPATDKGLSRLSLFEFYWAPYTEGKVTYRAVLWWLARTVLTPLRYLGANLQVMFEVERKRDLGSILRLFLREMRRASLLYLPMAAIVAYLGFFLASSPRMVNDLWMHTKEAFRTEPHPLALVAITICLAMVLFLALFIRKELWSWTKRAGPGMEQTAEVSWLILAAVSLAFFLASAAAISWYWGVGTSGYARQLIGWRPLSVLVAALLALLLRRMLVHYVGDVAVYVTADEKSAHYAVRAAIVKASTEALVRLLRDQNRPYDQVILAGHSLGSVIAYDTINELLSQVWAAPDPVGQGPVPILGRSDLRKLRGLVTFGSPLDKIYYFFREQVKSDQAIRAQILSFLHSFRRGYSGRDYGTLKFQYSLARPPGQEASAFPELDDDFRWLNVWSKMDPVSGPLRFYRLAETDQLARWYWIWGLAHLKYWEDRRFYRFVAEKVL